MYIEVMDMRNIFHRSNAAKQKTFKIPAKETKVHWTVRNDPADEMGSSIFQHYDEWNLQQYYGLNPWYLR